MVSAHLTIDLDAIAANYALLSDKADPAACAAVVKCDAYGLGAIPVATALWKAGCRIFYVATVEEGLRLRVQLADATIKTLHGISSPDEAEISRIHRLTPILNHTGQWDLWELQATESGQSLDWVAHIDTGMHRLGFPLAEFEELFETLHRNPHRSTQLAGLMSHLACADDPSHPMNDAQLKQVQSLQQRWPEIPLCFANSSGLFLGDAYHFDEVRPGAALYGLNPQPGTPNPLATSITLNSPILQVSTAANDGTAGYGASYPVQPGSKLAVVQSGYGDGIFRQGYDAASAILHYDGGMMRIPYAGRVSMDLITLDVSQVPEAALESATHVELIGPNLPPDEVAVWSGTIGYEVLTRLGTRYRRSYVGQYA